MHRPREALRVSIKMAGGAQSQRNDKPSIKYRCNPLGGDIFYLSDFDTGHYTSNSSDNGKQNSKRAEVKSREVLTTAELISAVGQIWDFATRPLSPLLPKTTPIQDNTNLWKGNVFYHPTEGGKITASTSAKDQNISASVMSASHSPPPAYVQPNLDFLHVMKKMPCSERCSKSSDNLLRCTLLGSNILNEPCKEGLSSITVPCDLRNRYGWMSEIRILRQKDLVNLIQINNKKIDDCRSSGETTDHGNHTVHTETISDSDSMTRNPDCNTEIVRTSETSCGRSAGDLQRPSGAITSLPSDYLLTPSWDMEVEDTNSVPRVSYVKENCCINLIPSGTNSEEGQDDNENDMYEKEEDQQKQSVARVKCEAGARSSRQHELRYALAKQEHAFAGAFSGIFVSLCLHPVDTVKTVIQSCHTHQRSIHYISKSIISERGVLGLYRGIASNIASSAPISAIYTFTYESVKAALLPLLAKDNHSFAHCMAGGCASVATSFVFTPSERIKQQMQVGSHYNNCWNALFGIVQKGGFSSLYAGWGAVLCRNVPHSIIKFYTYESLKHMMLSPLESNTHSTTALTLVCGGLAGSTAALFTTPFDVVKTRLQTQIPGSNNHYNGVFNTLREISRIEGLKGLYRGLTPRLAMYMTQGALFFASYESFKRFFALANETKTEDALLKAS